MLMNIKYLIISVLLFSFFAAFSQNSFKEKDYYIEPSVSWGTTIPTEAEDSLLWLSGFYGANFCFGKQTTGEHPWERAFNCPDYGIGLKYAKSEFNILGSRVALYGYFNGRIYENKYFGLNYKVGGGLSLWTKKYDEKLNPYNVYIGTTLNCHINLEIGAFYKMTPHLDLLLSAVISHSSNGAVALPNRGVNALSGQLGVRYHLNGRKQPADILDTLQFYPKNSLYFTEAPGILESHRGGETKLHYANTFQIGYARQFNQKFRYGAGFDLMYSTELLMMIPEEQRNDYWRALNSAVYANFDVVYNRLVLHIAFATYIYKSFDFFIPVYERVGVKYMLGENKNHSLGVMMKVHFGSIDYIEWAYSFQFFNWLDKKSK